MKQLLILSGKGGTGKTTIASSFIKLSNAKAFSDCDVDAPNLHLVLKQSIKSTNSDFYGMPVAEINKDLCNNCNECFKYCRFNAIKKGDKPSIDVYACEGCGLCEVVCPQGAISMVPIVSGELELFNDEKVFSTAQLRMGRGNSGLLVKEVKNQMTDNAKETEIAIIDGSPGIGCPVIASLSGVNMVLIVAEPTLSGISDLKRIIDTSKGLGVDIMVCINKFDINLENTKKIEDLCNTYNIKKPTRIPFDKRVSTIINNGESVVEVDCPASGGIKTVYKAVIKELLNNKGETE